MLPRIIVGGEYAMIAVLTRQAPIRCLYPKSKLRPQSFQRKHLDTLGRNAADAKPGIANGGAIVNSQNDAPNNHEKLSALLSP